LRLTVDYDQKVTNRIDVFIERLSHLRVDDLAMVALPAPEPEERADLLARAKAAALAADRVDEVQEASVRAREAVIKAFAFRGYEPTWFGLNWGRSLGRAEDRARLIAAVEDAAVAEVIADLLPDDAAALREPFEIAASMAGAAPASNPRIDSMPSRSLIAAAGVLGWMLALGPAVVALVATAVARRRRNLDRPD